MHAHPLPLLPGALLGIFDPIFPKNAQVGVKEVRRKLLDSVTFLADSFLLFQLDSSRFLLLPLSSSRSSCFSPPKIQEPSLSRPR